MKIGMYTGERSKNIKAKTRKAKARKGVRDYDTVACRPVAKYLLYKKRPLLGNRFLISNN
jgi:hypothetical protein